MISKARLLSALAVVIDMPKSDLKLKVHNENRTIADAWWLGVCDCKGTAGKTHGGAAGGSSGGSS